MIFFKNLPIKNQINIDFFYILSLNYSHFFDFLRFYHQPIVFIPKTINSFSKKKTFPLLLPLLLAISS